MLSVLPMFSCLLCFVHLFLIPFRFLVDTWVLLFPVDRYCYDIVVSLLLFILLGGGLHNNQTKCVEIQKVCCMVVQK